MWIKNLFFAAIVILGILFSGYFLLPANRVPTPSSYDRDWSSRPDVAGTLEKLDQEFQANWKSKNLKPTPEAKPLVVVRRLSLGLTGTVPSLEEIRKLEQQPEDQQVNWWISRLLEDRRTSDYVAERLARAYVGTEDGPFVVFRRRRFVTWLSDQLHSGRAYNEIVKELLVDQGLWTDSAAVNFMTVTLNEDEEGKPDPIRLAGRTSRAFLGMRIDCLQCHDDFLGTIYVGDAKSKENGTQEDFHKLAAFFNDTTVNLGGLRDTRQMQHYQYKFLDDEEESTVAEGVPFSNDLLPQKGTRRERLAAWVTHKENKQFARAIVNRVWAIVTGRPLVEPIDDIPLHGPFPPGLETLAEDFIRHDFNLKRLIRLIALSDVMKRDSVAPFEITSKHERYWASFPLTRLRPEQVASSVIQATSLTTIDSTAHIIQQVTKFGMENDFVQRYGDIGEDEFEQRGATITQTLILMNGDLVRERLAEQTATTRIPFLNQSNRKAIEMAYLCIYTRRPDEEEYGYFMKKFDGSEEDRYATMQDIFWELINGNEFAFNH